MSSAKAIGGERDHDDGPPGPARQAGTSASKRLDPEQAAGADQAPGEDARQHAGSRALRRTHGVVGADPKRGEPDGDEQQPVAKSWPPLMRILGPSRWPVRQP